MHDLLGLGEAAPSFAKQYASLGALAAQAARAFAEEVADRKFPGDEHSYR
jgi:3-methyl-2-oxobutanoate hydroxymethyltransferase